VSSTMEDTRKSELRERLGEFSRKAYHEPPVTHEMVAMMYDKVVIAITDSDIWTLEEIRRWFIMLPSEGNYLRDSNGELSDLRGLRDLLDQAHKLGVPPQFIAELKKQPIKRTILECAHVCGSITTMSIAKMFHFDSEEVHRLAAQLQANGYISSELTHPDDPGYTWSITERGHRAYELLYR